jgi:GGDEF domain-containing protein
VSDSTVRTEGPSHGPAQALGFVRSYWPNALLPVAVVALVGLALWVDPTVALGAAAMLVVVEGAVLFHYAPRYMTATAQAALWESRAEEVRDAHLRFRERAIHEDPDTGCGNLRQLKIDWVKGIARFRRRDEPFDIVLFELHHSLGRNAMAAEGVGGIAEVLLGLSRSEDSVCRIGDRIFAVLLSTTTYEGGHSFVERVRVRANTELFHKGAAMTFLELRAGVAEWKDEFKTLDAQLEECRADMVRYQAEFERQAAEFKSRPELFQAPGAEQIDEPAETQSPPAAASVPPATERTEAA